MTITDNPTVAIIIVAWNGKNDTLECLQSLRGLTYSNHRIILVDNGSTDGTVAAVRSSFPDVTILEMGRNLRFAGGNNKGIEFALGKGADYVLLLNNDTVVEKEFLSTLVKRMQSDDRIGMVAPKVLYYTPPNRIWFAGARIRYWLGTIAHIGIREEDRGQHNTPGETDYATGCCVLARKAVIESIGMLDESYFMYVEDVEWSVRATKNGFRVIYEPRSEIRHKVSVSAGGNLSLFKLRNKYISQMRFFGRHARWYHWLVFPWLSILINLVLLLSQVFSRNPNPAPNYSDSRKSIDGKK